MNRIAVGLSRAGASRSALRWAAERACETGSELLVVTAVADPRPLGSVGGMQIPCIGSAALEAATLQWQQHVIAETLQGVDLAASATRVVEVGSPSWVLLRRSADADLLVLGASRRRIGSVVRRCTKKSRCPVAVIEASPTE